MGTQHDAVEDAGAAEFGGVSRDKSTATKSSFFSIASDLATASVKWDHGPPVLSITLNDETESIIHTDLPHRSYVFDGQGIAHYSRYFPTALHVGLGEKAAPMDLSNRHFVLSATDCFGYDAHHTDPMYKHIPLLMTATAEYAVATFSTSHSRGWRR